MFIGEYAHSVDAKGRLIMPAKFREELGITFIVTKGLDGCLFVYSKSEWTVFENKLKSLPLNRDARTFNRFFFAGAIECEVDKQGRILISQNLRDYANLDKDVVIIGVSNRIEIWNKEKWDSYCNSEDISADDIAERMAELGI